VLAKKLGASVYIDSQSTNAAEALQELGGAQVILATTPSSKAMSGLSAIGATELETASSCMPEIESWHAAR
jgi:D-arabinose 1-dehydrogenase-like Zn-dependent alcohol dehydrogenase